MNEQKKPEEKSATLGWRFWVMIIIAGIIGRLFGIIGGAIVLCMWFGVEWLVSKNKKN